jgi:hypothetical protein
VTAVLDADLQSLTDDDLADLYGTDTESDGAIIAELNRRDRADRLARARATLAVVRAEGEQAAYAQYLRAEEWCRGRLLSHAGMAAGIRETDLWRMPADRADRLGSEELRDFHLYIEPRMTAADYVRQHAAEARAARTGALDHAADVAADTDTEQGAEHDQHDQHSTDRPGLVGDDAGAFRPGSAAAQAPQDGAGRTVRRSGRGADVTEDAQRTEPGTGRPGRPVRGVGRVTAADVAETARDVAMADRVAGYFQRADAAVAAARAGTIPAARSPRLECDHPHRVGTDRQCRTCPAPRSAPTAVAVRSGTVATRDDAPKIPGGQLLDLLADRWFGRYARFPGRAALDVTVLWAAHAHMRDPQGALVFQASPRLFLLSSEPGSGKTKVLELLGMIVPNCYGIDLEPTSAGLAYTINREKATVLVDESDILFGRGQRRADVRAVINGGAYRHGTVLTGKGAKATRTAVFGPMAIAGLDSMETATGTALEALLSRGVKVRMVRASGDDAPVRMSRGAEGEAAQAQKWLAAWAAQVRDEIADAEPELPEGLDGRPADMWLPLLAVADAAGGDWPARARAACAELTMATPAAEEDGQDLAEEFEAFAAAFGAGEEDE